MKALTLQLAVLDAILDQNDEFSVYDLTRLIRNRMAENEYDIIDIDDEDFVPVELNGSYVNVPNLPHKDVKISFENLEENGVLEKLNYKLIKHGAYRIYKKNGESVNTNFMTPIAPSNTSLTQDSLDKIVLEDRINKCINKWLSSNEIVTLRRVCNSIQEKGFGVYELADMLKSLGFNLEEKTPFFSSVITK